MADPGEEKGGGLEKSHSRGTPLLKKTSQKNGGGEASRDVSSATNYLTDTSGGGGQFKKQGKTNYHHRNFTLAKMKNRNLRGGEE